MISKEEAIKQINDRISKHYIKADRYKELEAFDMEERFLLKITELQEALQIIKKIKR